MPGWRQIGRGHQFVEAVALFERVLDRCAVVLGGRLAAAVQQDDQRHAGTLKSKMSVPSPATPDREDTERGTWRLGRDVRLVRGW